MNQTHNQIRNRKGRMANWNLLSKSWITALVILSFSLNSYTQTCQKSNDQAALAKNLTQLAWEGNTEQISKIITENPSLINLRLTNNETLLTIAAWSGNLPLAEYTVKAGIDVNMKNDWNNTALHNAAQQGFTDIASLLLKSGAETDALGTSGNTSLSFAASNGHLETVRVLLKAGSNPNSSNDYNQTPLVVSSWEGNPEIVGALVEAGAKVDNTVISGNTILHNLAYSGNTGAIKIILDKGADANIINEEGNLPLHMAVMYGNAEAAEMFVNRTKNIDIQESNLGNTPLHMAAINGDLKSTIILLNAGADPSIKNNSGKVPADYAVKYGYTDVVNYYVSNKLAPKESLKLTAQNREKAEQPMGTDEAKVVYCGHSGWVVETKNHFLVFDYLSQAHYQNPSLVNGSVSPEEIKDKEVIVFVSHDHSDHYDQVIHSWAAGNKNIQYVFGFKPEESSVHGENAYPGTSYEFIENNQQKVIDGVEVTTFKSTDTGQGFLVRADGVTIYHPGDHAWFADEDEIPFKKEVDFVASQATNIDIAFLPVSGCPSRWKKESIIAGFMYSLDKLNPNQVYPMHALQREYTMKEFAELADEAKSRSQIVCSENIGDNFIYTKTMVASK